MRQANIHVATLKSNETSRNSCDKPSKVMRQAEIHVATWKSQEAKKVMYQWEIHVAKHICHMNLSS